MAETNPPAEFPGNLLTNAYILQDFGEIAYIVCTAAISPDSHETKSPEDILAQLRNAEVQFRKASIFATVDAKQSELFLFFKKADIIRDQQTMLRKFGQICQLNHCKISYKNACRLHDLMSPKQARLYELFTAAVLANLRISGYNGSKIANVGNQVFLAPMRKASSEEDAGIRVPETQWHLQKLELQLLPSGQLLLVIKGAIWPHLTAMADLIDPEIPPLEPDTTLYLIPVGQLARYRGKWHTPFFPGDRKWTKAHHDPVHAGYRNRWIKEASEWLEKKFELNNYRQQGTIWLEIELPVIDHTTNVQTSGSEGETSLEWRTLFWPASLSYAFIPGKSTESATEDSGDPLKLAQEWFLSGASQARQQLSKLNQDRNERGGQEEGQLFDDESHLGSPTQFMTVPMQAFTQSQMIYPTPPDALNAQPTPGFSVDGSIQTPMPSQQTQVGQHSSPLPNIADASIEPAQEAAIANFLKHDAEAEADAFDDIDEAELEQTATQAEPNWDFFDTEDGHPPMTLEKLTETDAQDVQPMMEERPEALEEANTSPGLTLPSFQEQEEQIVATEEVPEEAAQVEFDQSQSGSPSEMDFQSNEPKFGQPSILDISATLAPRVEPSHPVRSAAQVANKRRRSSAFDMYPKALTPHDQKYSTSGKYWFELKKDSSVNHENPGSLSLKHRFSSSSESSASSHSSSTGSSEEHSSPQTRPWTQYEPADPSGQVDQGITDDDLASNGLNVQKLLALLDTGPCLEPFTSPFPSAAHDNNAIPDTSERKSMIFQLLTEQLTQSSLLCNLDGLAIPEPIATPVLDVTFDNAGSNSSMGRASIADLTTILPVNGLRRPANKPTTSLQSRIRVRQADSDISVDLPIVSYWETLSLQPFSGPKDVLAICLCPFGDNYAQGSTTFLSRMSETWSSCNLGTHRSAALNDLCTGGVVAWTNADDLLAKCRKIADAMAEVESQEDCTVIYMIIPRDDLHQCVELCDALVELFEAVSNGDQFEMVEFAPQFVPASFIANNQTMVVQPEARYIDLALEVYQRVPPITDLPEAGSCAPAIVLDEQLSSSLHFELNPKFTSPLSRHGQCCHLAYSISIDGKWMVAAWTDSSGGLALSMSYCLYADGGTTRRPRAEIWQHMCETSVQLMMRQRGKWWLAIAKLGFFDKEELIEWMSLSIQTCDEHRSLSRIALLSVDLQSRVSLCDASRLAQTSVQNSGHAMHTPVSTPQAANTTSPEQHIPPTPTAAAPGGHTPPDTTAAESAFETGISLMDPVQDTWFTTLPFGLNQSENFLNIRPALMSGFLLKRVVPDNQADTGVAMLGVSLVAVPRKATMINAPTTNHPPNNLPSAQEREEILQDVLRQYQALHVLAIARRCIDPRSICVPWHVVVAYRGVKVLERYA